MRILITLLFIGIASAEDCNTTKSSWIRLPRKLTTFLPGAFSGIFKRGEFTYEVDRSEGEKSFVHLLKKTSQEHIVVQNMALPFQVGRDFLRHPITIYYDDNLVYQHINTLNSDMTEAEKVAASFQVLSTLIKAEISRGDDIFQGDLDLIHKYSLGGMLQTFTQDLTLKVYDLMVPSDNKPAMSFIPTEYSLRVKNKKIYAKVAGSFRVKAVTGEFIGKIPVSRSWEVDMETVSTTSETLTISVP